MKTKTLNIRVLDNFLTKEGFKDEFYRCLDSPDNNWEDWGNVSIDLIRSKKCGKFSIMDTFDWSLCSNRLKVIEVNAKWFTSFDNLRDCKTNSIGVFSVL